MPALGLELRASSRRYGATDATELWIFSARTHSHTREIWAGLCWAIAGAMSGNSRTNSPKPRSHCMDTRTSMTPAIADAS